jgi:biopolymer transport protein ExbD
MKIGKKALFTDINITPLTDIFLVLLIIMMVVAPMMQQSNADITPPGLSSGSAIKQGLLTVEVTQKGDYFVDGQPVAEANLTQALTDKKAKDTTAKDSTVMIRADKSAKSSATLAILAAAREAQFDKVTVAGQNLSETRQQQLTTPVNDVPPTEMTP